MNLTLSCSILRPPERYEIIIESGLLDKNPKISEFLKGLNCRCAIITSLALVDLYGRRLESHLLQSGLDASLFAFPDGEEYKTRETKELLENQLFEQGFSRDTCLIALGGGVVTDLTGFIAGTLCRGVQLVMVPTTLLGMVDASIGGKTGVDVPYGKNLIGCTYQPRSVFIDPLVLKTLPIEELKNGVVEMIKHGLIADATYFDFMDRNALQILAREEPVLEKGIFGSCSIKQTIVEEDVNEQGKRRLLNFGHTIGHAVESLTHYAIPHGRAVAIGILVEGYMALQLGYLKRGDFERIQAIFKKYSIDTFLTKPLAEEEMLKVMKLDKKAFKRMPRFVLLEGIGTPLSCEGSYCKQVEESIIKEALQWMNHDLCRH